MNQPPASESRAFRPVWRRSGSWMVIMMFVYAGLMVGAMYLYWIDYTRPYRPLQEAINAKHPNSMPRVVGGRHKSHREGSQPTLRIVVTVDFDPLQAPVAAPPVPVPPIEPVTPPTAPPVIADRVEFKPEMPVDDRVHEWFRSLLTLAKQHHDLKPYEVIEIILEYRRPEKTNRTLASARPKAEWFAAYAIEETPTVPNGIVPRGEDPNSPPHSIPGESVR